MCTHAPRTTSIFFYCVRWTVGDTLSSSHEDFEELSDCIADDVGYGGDCGEKSCFLILLSAFPQVGSLLLWTDEYRSCEGLQNLGFFLPRALVGAGVLHEVGASGNGDLLFVFFVGILKTSSRNDISRTASTHVRQQITHEWHAALCILKLMTIIAHTFVGWVRACRSPQSSWFARLCTFLNSFCLLEQFVLRPGHIVTWCHELVQTLTSSCFRFLLKNTKLKAVREIPRNEFVRLKITSLSTHKISIMSWFVNESLCHLPTQRNHVDGSR